MAAAIAHRVATGSKLSGRQSWRLLWASSRPLSLAVVAWAALDTLDGPFVVAALGFVVGAVPPAVADGMSSAAGDRLIVALVVAAVLYAASLIIDPVGGALGMAASQRITGQLQARLLTAVTAPATVAHLEDQATLDRLASAEGSLTGYFPGNAPVTWVGSVANRLSGVFGCAVIAAYYWWLGLLLLVIWVAVRQVILKSVLKQAIDMRGQTPEMRRAWYYTGVGSKARDAKEVRVFGLARFFGGRYAHHFTASIRAGQVGLRGLHARATACFVLVMGGYALAIWTIADAARTHELSTRSMAIMLPMLAITAAAGNVSLDDITLAWTLFGLPDADRLERDLAPPSELDGSGDPGDMPARGGALRVGQVPLPDRHHRRPGRDRPGAGRGPVDRAGRRQRRGQVHAGLAAVPAPRPDRRPDHGGRHRRPRAGPGPLAAHDRADAAGPGALPAVRLRQRRVRRPGARRRPRRRAPGRAAVRLRRGR